MRFVMVLLAVLLCPGPAAAQGRLVMAGAVCVDGPAITLADLVRAEGEDARTFLAAVGTQPLLASPRFDGARANLNGARLRELIVLSAIIRRVNDPMASTRFYVVIFVPSRLCVDESRTSCLAGNGYRLQSS